MSDAEVRQRLNQLEDRLKKIVNGEIAVWSGSPEIAKLAMRVEKLEKNLLGIDDFQKKLVRIDFIGRNGSERLTRLEEAIFGQGEIATVTTAHTCEILAAEEQIDKLRDVTAKLCERSDELRAEIESLKQQPRWTLLGFKQEIQDLDFATAMKILKDVGNVKRKDENFHYYIDRNDDNEIKIAFDTEKLGYHRSEERAYFVLEDINATDWMTC